MYFYYVQNNWAAVVTLIWLKGAGYIIVPQILKVTQGQYFPRVM